MINLIPPTAKKSTLFEYWARVLTVWFTLFSMVLLAAAGILLPTYVLIDSQVSVYETSAAAASEKVASYDSVSEELIEANQQAKVAIDEYSPRPFSEYISLFESLQEQDIQVSEITLARDVEGIAPVLIKGVALDRQSLASFRERLLEIEEVTLVDLPISNLAKDSDISFSLTVTLGNANTDSI